MTKDNGATHADVHDTDPEEQPLLKAQKAAILHAANPEKWWQDLVWLSARCGAIFLFVFLGAGQALATRASLAADGTLPYDTSAAVALAELLKLLFSVSWLLAYNRQDMQWQFPTQWRSESTDLGAVAFLYSTTNEINFYIVEYLGAALFMMLSNLKLAWTCFFMSTMLGKRFAPLQWVAVFLMTISAIFVKLPDYIGSDAAGQSSLGKGAGIGLALTLISTCASGLASVKNEMILKKNEHADAVPMPFMAKNAVLYLWCLCLNLLAWALWGKYSLSACFYDKFAVVSILCLVGLGLALAIMLRYLNNVVRCFSSVAQVLVTVVLSRALPSEFHEGHLGLSFTASLGLLAVALVLYQAHASKHLPLFIALAVCVTFSAAGVGRHYGSTI